MYILLFPLLLVVLLQGILPFSMMLVSGVKNTMQKNAVDIDSNIVENHQVVLDNAWTANFRFKGEGISSADDFSINHMNLQYRTGRVLCHVWDTGPCRLFWKMQRWITTK